MLLAILLTVGAYLLGSISSAVLVCRAMGLPDPRTAGSRNPGATNVLRLGSKVPALLTLLGDFLKGLLPMVLVHALEAGPLALAGAGLGAFLGHLFPVFFQFRGGKGVATALGVLLGYAWPVGLATLGAWLLVATVFRFSSLASLSAAALAPVFVWWLAPTAPMAAAAAVMALMLFWRHRENIQRLLAGSEGKIGAKAR